MTWKLWLDDQLDDSSLPNKRLPDGYIGARSTAEAVALLKTHGLPGFMSLDFDLGKDDRAIDFLYWMYELFPNGPIPDYAIHTENPVGREMVRSYLESWKKSLKL